MLLLLACAHHEPEPEAAPVPIGKTVASCADFAALPEVTAMVGTLGRLRTVNPPVYPGYDPLLAWVLFTGSVKGEACGLLWHGGRTIAVGTLPAGEARQAWLRAHGTELAATIAVDDGASTADRLTHTLRAGFVTHVLTPAWQRAQPLTPWPAWDVPAAPASVVNDCYGSAADVLDERQALRAAAMSGIKRESRNIVCAHLKAFSYARAIRRAKRPARCADAEDILELEVGVPDFMTWKTELALGAVDVAGLQGRLEAPLTDPSSVFGAGQVFVLDSLDRLRPAVDRIPLSASPSTGALYAESRNALGERCAQDD